MRTYTTNLGLLKVDATEPLANSDVERLFGINLDTIDTSIHALADRIQALANAGYTPVAPVTITGNALTVRVENASTRFDIPALLGDLPARTPVRITNFTMTLDSVSALTAFYDLLDTLYGLDAGGAGLTKAQMHGTVRLEGTSGAITVSGAQMSSWAERYPSITVIPGRIENRVYYYNADGSELLYAETVYDNAGATYAAIPVKAAEDGYIYSFRGWSTASNSSTANAVLTEISQDMTVYAAYVHVLDAAPTLSVTAYSSAVGRPATATVSGWGPYSKITALTALDANGNEITASPGDGILSVTVSESGGESVATVSVTPDSAFFNGSDWALTFSDQYGSCRRSVPFNLRNPPVVTVRKTSSGSGDDAVLDVVSWGAFTTVSGYTCACVTDAPSGSITIGNATPTPTPQTRTLTPHVSGNVITLTPDFTPESGSVTASYLTFSDANDSSIRVNADIFG